MSKITTDGSANSNQSTRRNSIDKLVEANKSKVEKIVAHDFSKQLNQSNKDQDLKKEISQKNATSQIDSANLKHSAKPVPDQVFMVNNLINQKITYKSDLEQFNVPDYWQSPAEIKNSLQGDCEDFAVIKYDLLMQRGINETQLDLAYGKLNGKAHLVTLYTDNDGNSHVLDNVEKDIQLVEQREDLDILVRFKIKDVVYGENGWIKILDNIRQIKN